MERYDSESIRKSKEIQYLGVRRTAQRCQCQWVLRIKKNAAGEVEKYKVHLVVKGFTQIYLENIVKIKNVPYREAVGSLMYAAMRLWGDKA
jgi:hypothetical protein